MDVRVVDEGAMPTAAEPDYVRVRVARDPLEDTLVITTIERVVRKSTVKPPSPPRRVKTLIRGRPMTFDEALGFAKLYAASKHIGLVLTTSDA